MATCAGDREIKVVSGKLLDNPGELACIQFFKFLCYVCKSHHVRWGHDREISDWSVEALMYWPCHSEVNTSRLSLRFPCNDWMDEVNNLFITWPFLWQMWEIMDLSLWSIKTNNWSMDNFNELFIWASLHSHVTLVSGYPFRHLSIAHNMDVHHQVKDRWYTVFALDK